MTRAASPSLRGVRFAPVTAELLALDGVTVNHIRVWCQVWEQTLGRPDWNLSYRQVAEACGMSRATAIRCVAWLIAEGWMSRTPRADATGNRAPNLLAAVIPTGGGRTGATRGGVIPATRGGVTGEPYQESHYQEKHDQETADSSQNSSSDASPLRGDGAEPRPTSHLDDLHRLTELLLSEGVADDETDATHWWQALRAAGKRTPGRWVATLIHDGCTDTKLLERLEDYLPDDPTDRPRPQGATRHA